MSKCLLETTTCGHLITERREQMIFLEVLMSADMLTKSVLSKEEVCNLLIQIAEYKRLMTQLEIDVGNALGIDVIRITETLNNLDDEIVGGIYGFYRGT